MGQFKYMPKMESTEESAVLKLKKGGIAKKASGGAMAPAAVGALAAQMSKMAPKGAALTRGAAMNRPSPAIPAQAMGKKKGGEMESKSTEAKEEREIKGIKKELKSHENKPASKGHKGLKTGGVISKDGSRTGSVEQFRGGYKKGGKACMAEGGTASDIEKIINAKAPKSDMGQNPSEADRRLMEQQLADQKMDEATNRDYERFYSGKPSAKTVPMPSSDNRNQPAALRGLISKKTGGVMKKFADGGHCTMKSGGEGFKVGKKMSTW